MAALTGNLTVNGDRLWDSLMEMAKIGPGIAGGCNRQTLTDEDDWFETNGDEFVEATPPEKRRRS